MAHVGKAVASAHSLRSEIRYGEVTLAILMIIDRGGNICASELALTVNVAQPAPEELLRGC